MPVRAADEFRQHRFRRQSEEALRGLGVKKREKRRRVGAEPRLRCALRHRLLQVPHGVGEVLALLLRRVTDPGRAHEPGEGGAFEGVGGFSTLITIITLEEKLQHLADLTLGDRRREVLAAPEAP